jgi:GNAT superfamily N-acetyltransferase
MPVPSDKPAVNELSVRPATEEDCQALVELYRDAYGRLATLGFPTTIAEADREMVRSWFEDAELYVLPDDDRIVGGVRIRPGADDHIPQIGRIAVASEASGDGLGSFLLRSAEQRLRDRGHDQVRLGTFVEHPFLPEMYYSRGYEPVGVDLVDSRPYDILRLRKSL